jgi:uncharacterized protein
MDKEQIIKMKEECLFPDNCENSAFTETHISWIVLTDQYAFKVKRPVKFSFLDFSTTDKRKYYCLQEVKLNKRLAPDMYLGVIPITKSLIADESKNDEDFIDYAVQMKRMDNDKEMHKLLEDDKVTKKDMENLARKIAQFHKDTKIVKNAFNTSGMIDEFTDISNMLDNDSENQLISSDQKDIVLRCIDKSKKYLNENRSLFNDRIINGFQRDCHGDLNATNIFLYDDPVIFDCVEFNDEFRFIDVLNEIAFLCVDLDFYQHQEYGDLFYRSYLKFAGMREDEHSRKLFSFYKSYRANIRAKVTLISLKEHPDDTQKSKDVKKYIDLMDEYIGQL